MCVNTLGVITARSGSKGIKDKNIRELAGKPLIAYTIESALQCRHIDEVMVSTDSALYAGMAREYVDIDTELDFEYAEYMIGKADCHMPNF